MKQMLMMACLMLGCMSCTQNTANNNRTETRTDTLTTAIDIHTAENSLDYWGTYKGTLPSASGEGMETTLTLRRDMTYTLETVYVGKDDNTFEEKGDYSIDGNVITLSNHSDGNQYYQVQENQVVKLDNNRQKITGSLADHYILKKE